MPAAWETVNVWPATVSVPVRSTVKLFACTVYPTVPLPVPGLPNETVIQFALLVAVRAQVPAPLTSVMVMMSFPPAAVNVALAGLRLNTHGCANAEAPANPRRRPR